MDEDEAAWRASERDAAAYDIAREDWEEEQWQIEQFRTMLETDLEEWFDQYFDTYFQRKAAAAWEPAWTKFRPIVTQALQRAKGRMEEGAFDEAALLAASAVELVLRECFVRPVISGMFLGAAWAPDLADRFTRGATSGRIRELVLAVLRHVNLDLAKVTTLGGTPIWPALFAPDGLIAKRNQFVHALEPVDPVAVRIGLVAAVELLHQARRFGEQLGANAPAPDEI
jgi:hypothetical protein